MEHGKQDVVLTNMCMVEAPDGRILALQKTTGGYQGLTFPGGHVEIRESLRDAVIREVREETGLTIIRPEFCGFYNWIREDDSRYMVLIYKADRFEGFLKDSEEGKVFWVTDSEFLAWPPAEGMAEVLRICRERNLSEDFLYKERPGDPWTEKLV